VEQEKQTTLKEKVFFQVPIKIIKPYSRAKLVSVRVVKPLWFQYIATPLKR